MAYYMTMYAMEDISRGFYKNVRNWKIGNLKNHGFWYNF